MSYRQNTFTNRIQAEHGVHKRGKRHKKSNEHITHCILAKKGLLSSAELDTT